MLDKFTFFCLRGLLDNFLPHYFKGLIITLRTLNSMKMAGIFFNFNESCLFVFPYVIVNGENLFFRLHTFIQVGVFLFFTEELHWLDGFWRNPWFIPEHFQALFDIKWIIKSKKHSQAGCYECAQRSCQKDPHENHYFSEPGLDISVEIKTPPQNQYKGCVPQKINFVSIDEVIPIFTVRSSGQSNNISQYC